MFKNIKRVISSLSDSIVKSCEVVNTNLDSLQTVSEAGNHHAQLFLDSSKADVAKQRILLDQEIANAKKITKK